MNILLKFITIISFGSVLASPVYSGNHNTPDYNAPSNYNGNTSPEAYEGSHPGHHSDSNKGGIRIGAKVGNLIKAKVGIGRRHDLLDARAKVGHLLNAKVHVRRGHHDILNVKARIGHLLGAKVNVRRRSALISIKDKVGARI